MQNTIISIIIFALSTYAVYGQNCAVSTGAYTTCVVSNAVACSSSCESGAAGDPFLNCPAMQNQVCPLIESCCSECQTELKNFYEDCFLVNFGDDCTCDDFSPSPPVVTPTNPPAIQSECDMVEDELGNCLVQNQACIGGCFAMNAPSLLTCNDQASAYCNNECCTECSDVYSRYISKCFLQQAFGPDCTCDSASPVAPPTPTVNSAPVMSPTTDLFACEDEADAITQCDTENNCNCDDDLLEVNVLTILTDCDTFERDVCGVARECCPACAGLGDRYIECLIESITSLDCKCDGSGPSSGPGSSTGTKGMLWTAIFVLAAVLGAWNE